MEDFLQYIPILTVCVVGILLIIVLSVTIAPRQRRQAWDVEAQSEQSIQSRGCCCRRRRRRIQPIEMTPKEPLAQPVQQKPSTQPVESRTTHSTVQVPQNSKVEDKKKVENSTLTNEPDSAKQTVGDNNVNTPSSEHSSNSKCSNTSRGQVEESDLSESTEEKQHVQSGSNTRLGPHRGDEKKLTTSKELLDSKVNNKNTTKNDTTCTSTEKPKNAEQNTEGGDCISFEHSSNSEHKNTSRGEVVDEKSELNKSIEEEEQYAMTRSSTGQSCYDYHQRADSQSVTTHSTVQSLPTRSPHEAGILTTEVVKQVPQNSKVEDKKKVENSTLTNEPHSAKQTVTSKPIHEPNQKEKDYEEEMASKLVVHFNINKKKWLQNKVLCNLEEYSSINKFIHQLPHAQTVEKIWISNSPHRAQADKLKDACELKQFKPAIYIGRVHNYTSRDRQGLMKLVNAGFTLRLWENVSREMYTRCNTYVTHLEIYIQSIEGEAGDDKHDDYTEDQVVPIALGEIGITHLLTKSGSLYRSKLKKKKKTHAEIVFMDQQKTKHEGDDISQIWIKNSPCSDCSIALEKFFNRMKTQKGICIYIGSKYERLNELDGNERENALKKDKEGMVKLLRTCTNVRFELWETYNEKKYDEPEGTEGKKTEDKKTETIKYLKDVMREAGRTSTMNLVS